MGYHKKIFNIHNYEYREDQNVIDA